jgi:hypothetical protein
MRLLVSFLALMAGAVSPARAQDSCVEQIKFPDVGRWSEYKAVYEGKDKEPYTVRYAVVGSEQRQGKDLRWVELRMTGLDKSKNLIYQMLVPGSPAEMGDVQEIVFKPGEKPAMKLSGAMLNMVRGQMEKTSILSDLCKDVTLVGSERISVPAGQYQTKHFRSEKYSSDSWVSREVPFALVKSVGQKHDMALTAVGSGAKPSITEKPQEMPVMGGPSKK